MVKIINLSVYFSQNVALRHSTFPLELILVIRIQRQFIVIWLGRLGYQVQVPLVWKIVISLIIVCYHQNRKSPASAFGIKTKNMAEKMYNRVKINKDNSKFANGMGFRVKQLLLREHEVSCYQKIMLGPPSWWYKDESAGNFLRPESVLRQDTWSYAIRKTSKIARGSAMNEKNGNCSKNVRSVGRKYCLASGK